MPSQRSPFQRGRAPSPAPPPAPGFFPGRPELAPEAEDDAWEAPSEAGLDVAETRLLREQTALLVEEMRLLRATLSSPGAVARLQEAAAKHAAPASAPPSWSSAPSAAAPAPAPPDEGAAEGYWSGARFNDVMFERQNGREGHRWGEAKDFLGAASKRFVARREGGELPLGQVPQPGAAPQAR